MLSYKLIGTIFVYSIQCYIIMSLSVENVPIFSCFIYVRASDRCVFHLRVLLPLFVCFILFLFHISSSFIHRKMQTVHVIKLSNRGHCFTLKTFLKQKCIRFFRWMVFLVNFTRLWHQSHQLFESKRTHAWTYADERGREKKRPTSPCEVFEKRRV